MHALKPSYSHLQSVSPQRTVPHRQQRQHQRPQERRYPYRAVVVETTIKLSVNLVVSAAALSALAQLIPYRHAQEAKLKELQAAVQSSKDRLQQTRSTFSQYFDPYQTKAVMQQQSGRVDAQQRQIIWRETGKR